MNKAPKFAVITCCLIDWGGSEELWARSIPLLKQKGVNDITIYKNKINLNHPEFIKLKQQGVIFKEFDVQAPFLKNIALKIKDTLYRIYDKIGLATYNWNKPAEKVYNYLKASPPDLVLISQGINFDGLVYAYQCFKLKIPYIIVSHKAVDFYWPMPGDRAYMRETMVNARKCLFVSAHNKNLTEEQFGIRLKNSDIVINPVKTGVEPLPFPSTDKGYRLACVGRIFVIDKGQDILLRILSQTKWKDRDITVSFIGEGPDLDGLKEMAILLGLKNVSFAGYMGDLKSIWSNHHALILPSRSEGLPLTIIEAMSLGRIAIASNAGGNAEIIQDQVTGFIGEHDEKEFDRVLELAWSKREEWPQMGIKAAEYIKEKIPKSPERLFVNILAENF